MLAAVQSERFSKEIWFHFRSVASKCDQAKVILVYRHTPLRWSRDRTLRIPEVTFQSIKKDFTALVLWRLSLALLQLVAACGSKVYSKCSSFPLQTSAPDSQTPLQFRITASRIPFPLLNIPVSVWVEHFVEVNVWFSISPREDISSCCYRDFQRQIVFWGKQKI